MHACIREIAPLILRDVRWPYIFAQNRQNIKYIHCRGFQISSSLEEKIKKLRYVMKTCALHIPD